MKMSKLVFQGMCWAMIFWVGKQLCHDAKMKWCGRGPIDPEAIYDYEDSPYPEDDDYDDIDEIEDN